jgi:hypothetical protein
MGSTVWGRKELIYTVLGGAKLLRIFSAKGVFFFFIFLLSFPFLHQTVSIYFICIYTDVCTKFTGPKEMSAVGSFSFSAGFVVGNFRCRFICTPFSFFQ